MLGKRVPFNAPFIRVPADGTPVQLDRNQLVTPYSQKEARGPARLRFVCAMDMRENRKIQVFLKGDTQPFGELDIRFSYPFQPFYLPVSEEIARHILCSGVQLLQTEGREPTFFFANPDSDVFSIQLLFDHAYRNPLKEYKKRLFSLASLQPFGWMEGCVLDGLYSRYLDGNVRALPTIDLHLRQFIRGNDLVYEDPRSNIVDNKIYGIEGCLPFAIIARTGIGKQVLCLFINFIEKFKGSFAITDPEFLSAEGCYTLAYPLATLSVREKNAELMNRTLEELLIRKQFLRVGKDLYLRHSEGGKSFKNWGRAYVWYLLGLIQVYGLFKQQRQPFPQELLHDFRLVSEKAVQSLSDGLCPVFLGEPETGPDTSASAGIASALYLGCKQGVLGLEYLQVVDTIREALQVFFTPDGMLGGASQGNKDGERLQRSGYRVISPMAMGLLSHCTSLEEEYD